MNLNETVEENWEKRKFMSLSLNKEAVSAIMDSTEFLNEIYSKISLRTRAYVIKHGITLDTLPRCKCNCGRYAAINNTRAEQGFRVYCGPLCSRGDKTIDKSLVALFEKYEFLYDEKIVKQKSIEQIAEEYNISTGPVVKYLKMHNLYQLNDARSVDSKKIEMLTNHDQMYDYYITKNVI